MKDYIKKYRLFLYILLPFVLSFLINSFIELIVPVYILLIWPLCISFVIYWFWVGKQFAKVKFNKIKSFIIGNVWWGISVGLYYWQFIILDDSNRNLFLAALSQYYALFILPIAHRIIALFSNVFDFTQSIILSYIIMIVIFTLGFVFQLVRMKINESNTVSH
ncbi:hypothetical protein [Bacillus horti]|uniref:Uncharacterized protein n=1 Tax=Caldalkalibacillus horti TaxID=77523 RepID=A0ABT9W2H0_9BACI|nr:hypothetical protein [Bacillus horti]MDQ0167315.1 hypothetical protein [Bacillus horti]